MSVSIPTIGAFELIAIVVVGCILMSVVSKKRKRGGVFRKLVICGLVVAGVILFIEANDDDHRQATIIHGGQRNSGNEPWDPNFDWGDDDWTDNFGDDFGDRIGRRADEFAERLESHINNRINDRFRHASRARRFPTMRPIDATLEIQLQPNRLRRYDVEEEDVAGALQQVVDQIVDEKADGKADIARLPKIIVRDQEGEDTRFGDVARFSRHRNWGGNDWRDSRIKIDFTSKSRRDFDLEDLFDEIEDAADEDESRDAWTAVLTDEAIYIRIDTGDDVSELVEKMPEAGIPDRALVENQSETQANSAKHRTADNETDESGSDVADVTQTDSDDDSESDVEVITVEIPSIGFLGFDVFPVPMKLEVELRDGEVDLEDVRIVVVDPESDEKIDPIAKLKQAAESTASTESQHEQDVVEHDAPAEVAKAEERVVEIHESETGERAAKLIARARERGEASQIVITSSDEEEPRVRRNRRRSDFNTRAEMASARQQQEQIERFEPQWLGERPDWVDNPQADFRDGVYYVVRDTENALPTKAQCERALNQLLATTAKEYASLDSNIGSSAWLLEMPVGRLLNLTEIQCWIEEVDLDGQGLKPDYYRLHARFGFNDAARREIVAAWQAEQINGRLFGAGFGAAIILALVGSVFGYLRVDTATRGYYSGRLKFLTATIVIALLSLALVVFAEMYG